MLNLGKEDVMHHKPIAVVIDFDGFFLRVAGSDQPVSVWPVVKESILLVQTLGEGDASTGLQYSVQDGTRRQWEVAWGAEPTVVGDAQQHIHAGIEDDFDPPQYGIVVGCEVGVDVDEVSRRL